MALNLNRTVQIDTESIIMERTVIAVLLSVSASFAVSADVVEYKGKVNDILLSKSPLIKVGVLEDEDAPINCRNKDEQKPWNFNFERGHDYSAQWFDTLNLVRRTQETIRIGYRENSENSEAECSIEYLALLKEDGVLSDNGQVADSLERTGQYGNIAQLYTNDLTEVNYHASDYYGSDEPSAAFDGYIFNEQIVEGEGNLVGRGIWLVKKDKEEEESEYWLQVEFEELVNVSGFRVMVNEKSVGLGRGPRHVTVLSSTDGDEFEEQGQYTLSKTIDQRANLPTKIEARIFRIQVNSNFGDGYIEIDELEVYAD